jgi:4Fe-4S binding domain
MFGNVSEQVMHRVRWGVTLCWLLLIVSLFYDPITPALTRSTNLWSPFRIDPQLCIKVQGVCQFQSPYALGAACFWGMIIPASIFIMLVFGHELWRRICPLSFLSQLPRALGWQRNLKRVDPVSGRIRVELAKVKANSWLGRHYSYVQFGLLYIGLCGRILCFNADRTLLAMWLLGTIAAAIAVGYCFGGKSWCQYFCPMATVQHIFAQPMGVFTQSASSQKPPITQSMCRTIKADHREKSNCVACQSVCMDIDAEREYWVSISQPQRRFIYYAYAGLVVGYFLYYYLYAGNWEYYFSGIWAYEPDQLQKLTQAGFYILGHPIAIPKSVAAPLTLGVSSGAGYLSGRMLEQKYRNYLWKKQIQLSQEEIRHRLFSLVTYLIFNLYFVFGGRQFIVLLPLPVQYCYNLMLSIVSTVWICRVWRRSGQNSLSGPLLRKKMGVQQGVQQ